MKTICMSEKKVYEYSSLVKLDSKYFAIPSSIIKNIDLNEKRVTVFSYFSKCRDLDNEVLFSINHIAKWMGKQPNRTANGINNKIIQIIQCLIDEGYLTLSEEFNVSSYIDAVFNLSVVQSRCDIERFAIIYLDELKKILNCKNDAFANNDILLLVFAYLRMKIHRRKNDLLPEEINIDKKNDHEYDICKRRLESPDAYDCYYCEIAKDLGISARIVSKAVSILNELGLIYSESLPRIKYGNKWKTDHTIFCNTYKREGSNLLACGEDYYLAEVENKKKKLNIVDNR